MDIFRSIENGMNATANAVTEVVAKVNRARRQPAQGASNNMSGLGWGRVVQPQSDSPEDIAKAKYLTEMKERVYTEQVIAAARAVPYTPAPVRDIAINRWGKKMEKRWFG